MAPEIEGSAALKDLARRSVVTLDDGRDPGKLPEFEAGWNDAFVGAIREFKERYRGSKDLQQLLRITGELLYGKDVHWAMELVQNSEDAGSTRIAFVFESDRVLVWNDGAPFTSGDTWAICSAGHSPKRNKIGFFGIGFKSVYKLTAAPEIYSGPFALRIEDKLYPVPLPLRRSTRGAWFVLPVLPSQGAKLPAMLAAITSPDFAQVLLTLTSLSEIRVIDRTGSGMSGRFTRRLSSGGLVRGWDECEIGGSWPGLPRRRWRRFFYDTAAVPEGVSREGRSVEPGDRSLVILARPIGDPSAQMRLHCFLPTAVRSEVCWLVQADFEPNASREQLRDNSWNRWLMAEVGRALARAVYVSSRAIGDPPWELVPLADEVRDPLQRVAFDVAQQELGQTRFVQTRQGWRRPAESTWGSYPGITAVVKEGDLPAATGSDVSFVRDGLMNPDVAGGISRAVRVLAAMGASPVACAEVIRLLGSDDSSFRRVRRDPQWWLNALHLIERHGVDDDKAALARTACLPIRGGTRVKPSPVVAETGYLVAFSRADIGEDLRAYLGESEVFLVEPYLSPRSEGRRRENRSQSEIAAVREVATMLEAPPFNVAIDAGVYHVVASLVIPRMNSLEAIGALSPEQARLGWRLFEYVRQKWPTYVSEYRRRRTERATDVAIAAELGTRLRIVATVGSGRAQSRRLRPVSEAYLPSPLLGFDGMDVALSGDDQLVVVDDIHRSPLKTTIRRRGGRVRGAIPSPTEFLQMLGAPIGPRVVQLPPVQMGPAQIPWVNWDGIPAGARGRVTLFHDWQAPDVARLLVRWPSIAETGRARRGQALLHAIEADWVRLASAARAHPMYFYGSWVRWRLEAAATWIGRLEQIRWLPSASGTLEQPTDLVLETPGNRLALGGASRSLLRWRTTSADAVAALGVSARPSPDRVIDTLITLRSGEDTVLEGDALTIAGACYQVLAEHLREAGSSDSASVRKGIIARMRGGSGRGLIYAPPPDGVAGERWWPPSRVVQNDAARWVGPYLGQLARRYRASSLVWEALGIRRDLTPEIALEVIERELVDDPDRPRAHEYYGRIVAFLEDAHPLPQSSFPLALTTNGWVAAHAAWWTARPEVAEAFAPSLGWWEPGNRDPSTHRQAAAFLGVREIGAQSANDGLLTERWEINERAPIEFELESRWQLALRTWPHMLREDADLSQSDAIDALSIAIDNLTPTTAGRIGGRFTLLEGADHVRASISPSVILRPSINQVIGKTSDDLFGANAAGSISQLIRVGQRLAARSLALLLSMAAHDPAELEKLAARYSVAEYQHREFSYVPPESDELDEATARHIMFKPQPHRSGAGPVNKELPGPLADPERYGLVAETSQQPASPLTAVVVPGGLKTPLTDDHEGNRSGAGAGADGGTEGGPPGPQPRFSNPEIEGAAQPFVAEYELATRGTTIARQGPGVGADFLASDGRYIEVKAFSGQAGISFDLEPTEWRAAQRPGIGERYWVYVVEHLRDGLPPKITAVFNPVTDEFTQKEPTGKLRIRGWRSAAKQRVGEFGERALREDADDRAPDDPIVTEVGVLRPTPDVST